MPIVLRYDDPALVASLAGSAGQWSMQQQQQANAPRPQIIQRGSINDPIRIGGDLGHADVAGNAPAGRTRGAYSPQGMGGIGTIPIPDGRGGYQGGARIYYPTGTNVPEQEAAMTAYAQQAGMANQAADRQMVLQEVADTRRAGNARTQATHDARLRNTLGAEDDKREMEKIRLRAELGVSAEGDPNNPTFNQQRVLQKQEWDAQVQRSNAALSQIERDVKEAERELNDIKRKPGDANKALFDKDQKKLDELTAMLGPRLGAGDGLYAQRRAARTAAETALSAPVFDPSRIRQYNAAAGGAPRGAAGGGQAAAATPQAFPRSKAEYDKLPAGTIVQLPNGQIVRKK